MGSEFKHVMFEISMEQHQKLKLHCIGTDRTLKSILQEAVTRYVEALPEYVFPSPTEEAGDLSEEQNQGMGAMTL